mmetsp:Transcript_12809/g.39813  ORF Transcript_12809/g.39813 Transcript_12809/m.39813 type:complete len:250 (-) Transcript_12809:869-1618(-)
MAAAASFDVFSPTMTSTSGIFATGLKKCIPTMVSGYLLTVWSSVSDSDDVFVAKSFLPSRMPFVSSSVSSFFLMSMTSTAASTITSTSLKIASSVPPETRAIFFSRPFLSSRLRLTAPSNSLRTMPIPFSTASAEMSLTATLCPLLAKKCTIPDPMTPAPMTPTGPTLGILSLGRPVFFSTFFMPSSRKYRAHWFLASGVTMSSANSFASRSNAALRGFAAAYRTDSSALYWPRYLPFVILFSISTVFC